jgi:RIO kinase 1
VSTVPCRSAWVVTELGAVDVELGVLKTDKEADVHLLRRGVPGEPSCLLAAKRYRGDEHRLFHRDAGYLEGRRMRRSRKMRAMRHRTSFGRNLLAEQWAVAEFARCPPCGPPAPPCRIRCNATGPSYCWSSSANPTALPRPGWPSCAPTELRDLWHQTTTALESLAVHGLTHGDLSAYNMLIHNGQVVLIDLPQVVDVVGNPSGADFLARDVRNNASWLTARGLPGDVLDVTWLTVDLRKAAGLT